MARTRSHRGLFRLQEDGRKGREHEGVESLRSNERRSWSECEGYEIGVQVGHFLSVEPDLTHVVGLQKRINALPGGKETVPYRCLFYNPAWSACIVSGS